MKVDTLFTKFIDFITDNNLFKKENKILLAVSGGVDSAVMLDLFAKSDFQFAVAHCNFQLRAKESNGDELFVKELADKYKVSFFSQSFDTKNYAKTKNISKQMAARELRYEWFDKIIKENNFDFIATAHHSDDSAETFLINLIKGTGISGLHGIKIKNINIIRPLLFAPKAEIKNYAAVNKLDYRNDSSNSSNDYIRNKIRNQIIPVIKKVNPRFSTSIEETISRVKIVEEIYFDTINKVKEKVLRYQDKVYYISIKALLATSYSSVYLYEIIKDFGFNAKTVNNIYKSLNKISGKVFYSDNYKVIKDRNDLIITEISKDEINETKYISETDTNFENNNLKLNFNIIEYNKNFEISKLNTAAQFDFNKLHFPLTVRKWQKGDYFYPLGMKSRKKLSNYFIDRKISLHDKENIYVICSDDNIIWIINRRIDNRFRITKNTKKLYIISQ